MVIGVRRKRKRAEWLRCPGRATTESLERTIDTGVISFYRCNALKGLGESAANERADAKESGMASRMRVTMLAAIGATAMIGSGANARNAPPKLLFQVSADKTLIADKIGRAHV